MTSLIEDGFATHREFNWDQFCDEFDSDRISTQYKLIKYDYVVTGLRANEIATKYSLRHDQVLSLIKSFKLNTTFKPLLYKDHFKNLRDIVFCKSGKFGYLEVCCVDCGELFTPTQVQIDNLNFICKQCMGE